MKRKRLARVICAGMIIAALVLSGLVLPGLSPARAQEQRLRVVVSFSILADVVHNVAGDTADVETLIPLGQNPHAFEPSAQDVVRLSEADVVFTVGINFEESLADVIAASAPDRVTEVSVCVPVREIVQGVITDHDHAEDEDRPDGAEPVGIPAYCPDHQVQVESALGLAHLDAGSALGLVAAGVCDDAACDPHVWTDPANVALWTLVTRDTLSEYDPANTEVYAANADAYLEELAAAHAEAAALFDAIPAERRVVVTNHQALNYFAARYGLTLVGVVLPGGGTGAEPSVRDVLDLIETVQDYGVPAIFTETTVSDSLAQQIANEAGAGIVPLYTGSLSATDGPAATYLDYLRYNATQIADALR